MKCILTRISVLFLMMILLSSIMPVVYAENAVPSYIESIWNAYRDFSELNGHTYMIGKSVESQYHEENVISAEYTIEAYTSYSFDIKVPAESEYAVTINFAMDSNNLEDKSFTIRCYNDSVPVKVIKELILATLHVVEDGITDEIAQKELKNIVNSFDGKNHSNVYPSEDFMVFVSYDEGFSENTLTVINVIDKNRLVLKEEDRALYSQMTYDEMCAPLNVGEAVTFRGIPTKQIPNSSLSSLDIDVEFWEIALPDGSIKIRINFDSRPISLEKNTPYVFWGNIMGGEHSGTGAVRVDYVDIAE